MKDSLNLVLKVLLISVAISGLIKYGAPQLVWQSTVGHALWGILLVPGLMALLLLWRQVREIS